MEQPSRSRPFRRGRPSAYPAFVVSTTLTLSRALQNITLSTPPGSSLPPAELRIVNSPSNVHDAGKHLACSMASHEHCYFNDDDWLNVYMDTTYTKYLECCAGRGSAAGGGRIASNTLPIIHLEHRRWRFDNPSVSLSPCSGTQTRALTPYSYMRADIDLHTGFTWLGTGSFAPRHLSRRFMQQQAATPLALSRDQALVADMFFSLWTNAYPEQMPNDLVPIDVEGGEVGWSRGVDQWAVVYGNIVGLSPSISSLQFCVVLTAFRVAALGRPHALHDPLPLFGLSRPDPLPHRPSAARVAHARTVRQRRLPLCHVAHALPAALCAPHQLRRLARGEPHRPGQRPGQGVARRLASRRRGQRLAPGRRGRGAEPPRVAARAREGAREHRGGRARVRPDEEGVDGQGA